jgi:hypothetical protein
MCEHGTQGDTHMRCEHHGSACCVLHGVSMPNWQCQCKASTMRHGAGGSGPVCQLFLCFALHQPSGQQAASNPSHTLPHVPRSHTLGTCRSHSGRQGTCPGPRCTHHMPHTTYMVPNIWQSHTQLRWQSHMEARCLSYSQLPLPSHEDKSSTRQSVIH